MSAAEFNTRVTSADPGANADRAPHLPPESRSTAATSDPGLLEYHVASLVGAARLLDLALDATISDENDAESLGLAPTAGFTVQRIHDADRRALLLAAKLLRETITAVERLVDGEAEGGARG